jgi:DNA end-binding protein Ku
MPRAIWTGALSFGLVNVPVRLAGAARDHDIRFHQLHDEDNIRVQTVRYCPQDGEIVRWEHIVRGYEVSKDRYVPVTDEELESLDPKKTRTIDIQEFVSAEAIDPIYFDKPYYLVPDGEAAGIIRAYHLLVEAMSGSGKIALGRFVLHTKEYVAAIRTFGDALLLHTMHFHDEIRDKSELADVLPDGKAVAKSELGTVLKQIESQSSSFSPEQYRDFHQERIRALIEKKLEKKEDIAEQPPEAIAEPEDVPDLMAALERSLAESSTKAEDGQPAAANGRDGSTGKRAGARKTGKAAAKPKSSAGRKKQPSRKR